MIDYVGGYPDLEKRILRTIGEPEVRFSQDPVRMIRLLKFCARFNFEIERPTFEALLNCKKEILKSSSARVLEELLRMLESGSSKPFFHLLHEYGLLQALLPELAYFLESRPDSPILPILGEIDGEIKKKPPHPLDRSLLLSALIFPLFDEYLKLTMEKEKRPPHLGQIAQASHHVIDCVFNSFFQLPRRMRAIVGFLLTTQYRFVPFDGSMPRHARPHKDPFFFLALHLLKLRAAVDPSLLSHYTFWTEKLSVSPEIAPASPIRQRQRRKRR